MIVQIIWSLIYQIQKKTLQIVFAPVDARAIFVGPFSPILPQNQSFLLFVSKYLPRLIPFLGGLKFVTQILPLLNFIKAVNVLSYKPKWQEYFAFLQALSHSKMSKANTAWLEWFRLDLKLALIKVILKASFLGFFRTSFF